MDLAELEHGLQPFDDFLAPIPGPTGHGLAPVALAGNVDVVFAAANVFQREFQRLDFAAVQFLVHPARAHPLPGEILPAQQLALAQRRAPEPLEGKVGDGGDDEAFEHRAAREHPESRQHGERAGQDSGEYQAAKGIVEALAHHRASNHQPPQ